MTLPVWKVLLADGQMLRYQGFVSITDGGTLEFYDNTFEERQVNLLCVRAPGTWVQCTLVERRDGKDFYPVDPIDPPVTPPSTAAEDRCNDLRPDATPPAPVSTVQLPSQEPQGDVQFEVGQPEWYGPPAYTRG